MFCKGEFASVVTLIHATNLRHADVAFIGKNNRIVGDELKQCWGRLAGRPACEVA